MRLNLNTENLTGRPSYRLTDEQKEIAIKAYEEKGNLKSVADKLGITRWYLVCSMKADKKFTGQMANANDTYNDGLREVIDEVVKGKRQVTGPESNVIMFHTKSRMPEYRERVTQKVEGSLKVITGIPRPPQKKE